MKPIIQGQNLGVHQATSRKIDEMDGAQGDGFECFALTSMTLYTLLD
jgi:hypothetical protein